MPVLESTAAVIDELGGNKSVAMLFGVVPSAVSNWRANNRFSAPTYAKLTRELNKKGFTAPDSLWGMS